MSIGVVLILVLMEDTLRELKQIDIMTKSECLNPCFNGRYSQRMLQACRLRVRLGLNPCFNGRYSQSMHRYRRLCIKRVS